MRGRPLIGFSTSVDNDGKFGVELFLPPWVASGATASPMLDCVATTPSRRRGVPGARVASSIDVDGCISVTSEDVLAVVRAAATPLPHCACCMRVGAGDVRADERGVRSLARALRAGGFTDSSAILARLMDYGASCARDLCLLVESDCAAMGLKPLESRKLMAAARIAGDAPREGCEEPPAPDDVGSLAPSTSGPSPRDAGGSHLARGNAPEDPALPALSAAPSTALTANNSYFDGLESVARASIQQAWLGIKLVSVPEGGVVAGISLCGAPSHADRGLVRCGRCGTAVPAASIVIHLGECSGGVDTRSRERWPLPTQFLIRGATAASSQLCLEATRFRLVGRLNTLMYHWSVLLNHVVSSLNKHAYELRTLMCLLFVLTLL